MNIEQGGAYLREQATSERDSGFPEQAEVLEAAARALGTLPDVVAVLKEQTRLIEQFIKGDLVVYPSSARQQALAAIAYVEGK